VISGTAAEVTAALVTEGSLVVAATSAVTLTDVGSAADTNAIAAKTSGIVTTGQLITGAYASLVSGDKIATGLTFAAGSSEATGGSLPAADSGVLNWTFNADTGVLQFETIDDGTTPVVVGITLTGITSVTEAAGVFTLVTTP
jgi:hypothetical protein